MAKSSAKKFEAAFEPYVEFNNMVVKTAETAFNMHMQSMQAFAKLGMDNVNAGLKVRTMDDMVAYAEKQKDVAQKASDMFVADAKAFADLNAKFVEEARTMVESNVKSTVAAATEATKAA